MFISGGMNAGANQMVQRCVIITRDENGYGLTVSGDNPVFVQSVKEGESALFVLNDLSSFFFTKITNKYKAQRSAARLLLF